MSLLTKMLIWYFLIALGTMFWQPQIILGNQAPSVMQFFNINSYNSTTNQPLIPGRDIQGQPGFQGAMANYTNFETSNNQSTGSLFSRIAGVTSNVIGTIIDGLNSVLDVIITIFRVIFSPVIILTSPLAAGLPTILIMLFGYLPVLLMLISIVLIIRGIFPQ